MERFFTKQQDADRNILLQSSDNDILNVCKTSQYGQKLCDEKFFMNLVQSRYPKLAEMKDVPLKDATWKQKFLFVVFYKDKMKNEYNFDFTDGNPKLYYTLLTKYFNNTNYRNILVEILNEDFTDLFKYFFLKMKKDELYKQRTDRLAHDTTITDILVPIAIKKNAEAVKLIIEYEGKEILNSVIAMFNSIPPHTLNNLRFKNFKSSGDFLKSFL